MLRPGRPHPAFAHRERRSRPRVSAGSGVPLANYARSMSFLPRAVQAKLGCMSFRIGMLLFPNLTQLDLTGPYEVLSRIPESEIHLVWKDLSPVRSDSGLGFL